MKRNYLPLSRLLCAGILAATIGFAGTTNAHAETREIAYPVLGDAYHSSYFNPEGIGGRAHHGIDIFGNKGQPILSPVDGTITHVPYPEASYGYAVFIRDADGYNYWLLHLNNDNPGTDDGNGGGIHAYAPDVRSGASVSKGQIVGYIGDSGNAESTSPHIHFEIHRPSDNEAINPLESLESGTRFSEPVAAPRYKTEVLPYGQVASGANIALGDIDGDLEQELITGAGPGGGPHIRTFELDGTPITSFFAYDEGFRGGVDVAAGDTNGDGIDEIIVGAGPGGGPHIRVLTADGAEISNFFAYAQTFRGGIRVDAGDLDGDGIDEIVSGAGPGGGPHVQAFTQDGTPQANFMAFDPNFRNGIDVAVIDADETREARIAAAAGPGGGPHVRVFDTAGNPTSG